jgi:ammonia channel protein AmtB
VPTTIPESVFVMFQMAFAIITPTGWLHQLGVADFAGGTVVEINCGITGLVCALMLGRRIGYGSENTGVLSRDRPRHVAPGTRSSNTGGATRSGMAR